MPFICAAVDGAAIAAAAVYLWSVVHKTGSPRREGREIHARGEASCSPSSRPDRTAYSIMSSDFDHTLTNLARPKTSAIITVRVIKSFEFRTERSLVLRDINLDTTTVGDLKEIVRNGQFSQLLCASTNSVVLYPTPSLGLNSDPDTTGMEALSHCALWYANFYLSLLGGTLTPFLSPPTSFIDTLKLYTRAHGAKVSPQRWAREPHVH